MFLTFYGYCWAALALAASLRQEPSRLIKGCLRENLMTITNAEIDENYGDFHNSFVTVLVLMGIPGLVLALAFMILLAVRAAVLFFSDDPRADAAVKTLIAILPPIYLHNLLESSIFVTMDFRSLSFFLVAGAVLAYSYEICPPKRKAKN